MEVVSLAAAWRRPFEGFTSPRAWLFAIATQNFVPPYAREQEGLLDFVQEMKDRKALGEEAMWRRALNDMRREIRQPFLLVAVAGLSIEQTAAACRFSEEQVEKNLAIGYRRLARENASSEGDE